MKKKSLLEMPEKIFGLDTGLMIVFVKPLGLILLLVVVFNLLVFPKFEEIQVGLKSQAETDLKEKNYRQKINYLKSIDQESLQRDELLVNSALMPEKNSYLLVNIVKAIADKHDFSVDSFSVKLGVVDGENVAVKSEKGYSPIPVSIVLIGPSANYYDLALGLERSLPVLKIDKFDMKNTTGISTIDIEISGFYISDKKMIDVAKLTLADLTLKQEETELVSKLNTYNIITDVTGVDGSFTKQKEFVRYQRNDPFSQ